MRNSPLFQSQGFCFTLTFGMCASAWQGEGVCLILFLRAINTTYYCLCLCPLPAVLWCVCHRPSLVADLIKLLSFTFFSRFPWLLPACSFLHTNFSVAEMWAAIGTVLQLQVNVGRTGLWMAPSVPATGVFRPRAQAVLWGRTFLIKPMPQAFDLCCCCR